MNDLIAIGCDAVMIIVMVFGVYLPRNHRRDMVVAYLTVNVGVLAVSMALSVSSVAAGLGLGLFGVLSIIRLRSEELSQIETAYYFSALALGLLGGVNVPLQYAVPFMVAIVAVTALTDSRWVGRGVRRQIVALDRAYADQEHLRTALSERLGGQILAVTVQRLDFVNDTTVVEVRFRPDTDKQLRDGQVSDRPGASQAPIGALSDVARRGAEAPLGAERETVR